MRSGDRENVTMTQAQAGFVAPNEVGRVPISNSTSVVAVAEAALAAAARTGAYNGNAPHAMHTSVAKGSSQPTRTTKADNSLVSTVSKHPNAANLTPLKIPSVVTASLATPPPALHSCEMLVPVLECVLLSRIARGDNERTQNLFSFAPAVAAGGFMKGNQMSGPTVFHALEPPSISPSDYLARLFRYSYCSRSVFVAALLIMERVAAVDPEVFTPNSLNVHRLLVTAVLLATKSFDDILYDNAHFAKVGGLDLAELNMLELDMLTRLQFKLHITNEEYFRYEASLAAEVLRSTGGGHFRSLRHSLTKLGFRASPTTRLRMSGSSSPGSPLSVSDAVFCSTTDTKMACGGGEAQVAGHESEPTWSRTTTSYRTR